MVPEALVIALAFLAGLWVGAVGLCHRRGQGENAMTHEQAVFFIGMGLGGLAFALVLAIGALAQYIADRAAYRAQKKLREEGHEWSPLDIPGLVFWWRCPMIYRAPAAVKP
jgi:hypothetical protein